jgi:NOL1/NOP2/sun family putative RNA methylase
MINLPPEFIDRMSARLGKESEEFFRSYELPAQKGIRVNTLKISVKDFVTLSPFSLESVPWEKSGFYISEEKPGKHPFHAAGLYYVQEPSAMCAAPLLNVKAGERVLDLCSAPGGKGTQLAQEMNGEGLIVLNEINFDRAKILAQNVERMGITNAVVVCASPQKLAQEFIGYFDKILVDAPCSGEGMFKKEANAVGEWGVQNVQMCAERQREILNLAQKMLKSGGSMVYSTCTFSEEEDEGQVKNFLSEHKNFTLIEQKKLYPHIERGEGHFAALFKKSEGEELSSIKTMTPTFKDKKLQQIYRQFEKEFLQVSFDNLHLVGNNLYSLPDDMPKTTLQTLRAGVHLGEFKGDRFQPAHFLAMCLRAENVRYTVEISDAQAVQYLSGNVIPCDDGLKGWALVTYKGYPLGWCKAVNGTAKNHLPKGLRV